MHWLGALTPLGSHQQTLIAAQVLNSFVGNPVSLPGQHHLQPPIPRPRDASRPDPAAVSVGAAEHRAQVRGKGAAMIVPGLRPYMFAAGALKGTIR